MTLRTVALYAFAAGCFSAALYGCSTTSSQSQLTPTAPNRSREGRALVRLDPMPAGSIIVGYFHEGDAPNVLIYARSESGQWKYVSRIDNVGYPFAMRIGSKTGSNPLFVSDLGIDNGCDCVKEYSLANKGEYVGKLDRDVFLPERLAVDSVNDVAVVNMTSRYFGFPRVTLFPMADGDHPIVISNLRSPYYVVFDEARDLYVSDYLDDKIVKYAAGSDQVMLTIRAGVNSPLGLDLDRGGTLWVANSEAENVGGYRGTSERALIRTDGRKPIAVLKRGDHLYVAALGVDRADALIDYNLANDTHVEITDGVKQPESLADCAPDVCVLNRGSVTIYASDKLVQTIGVHDRYSPSSLTAEP